MKIKPEEVVARYKELNVRPMIVGMGITVNPIKGIWERETGGTYGCCAMGVMLLGRPYHADPFRQFEEEFGINPENFYLAFDNDERDIKGRNLPHPLLSNEDFLLGRAVRKAVIDAGLTTGWEP